LTRSFFTIVYKVISFHFSVNILVVVFCFELTKAFYIPLPLLWKKMTKVLPLSMQLTDSGHILVSISHRRRIHYGESEMR